MKVQNHTKCQGGPNEPKSYLIKVLLMEDFQPPGAL